MNKELRVFRKGVGWVSRQKTELSAEQKELRYMTLPPDVLADALTDPIHKDIGIGRAVRTVRNKNDH